MKGVSVGNIDATADVVDSTSVLRLKTVQQKRGAKWVTIGRKQPVRVTPGSTLRLRAQLAGDGATKWLPITVAVPKKVTRNGFLEVAGGLSSWDNGLYDAKTPAQLKSAINAMTKNDEIRASLEFFKRGKNIVKQAKSAAQAKPVRGRVWAEVKVKR
jgi:hypothetical protein